MRASRFFPVTESQEPVGLVIADGGLGDHVPRFSAFVWGPVPDDAASMLEQAPEGAPREESTPALCQAL